MRVVSQLPPPADDVDAFMSTCVDACDNSGASVPGHVVRFAQPQWSGELVLASSPLPTFCGWAVEAARESSQDVRREDNRALGHERCTVLGGGGFSLRPRPALRLRLCPSTA